MRRSRLSLLVLILAFAGAFWACPEKKPQGPPQELIEEIDQAEKAFEQLSAYSLSPEETSDYYSLLKEARTLMSAGDYEKAMDRALRAELEAVRLHGRLVYQELLATNPPKSLTYHYRNYSKQSENAEAKGDIREALRLAREALRQASLALEYQKNCMDTVKADLERIKQELELLYRPDYELIQGYWDAVEALSSENCDQLSNRIKSLQQKLEFMKSTVISIDPLFTVSASDEYVKKYGQPWMYKEVTKEGYLSGRVNQVPVGTRVVFIRSLLFSRSKTFYYVEDTRNGIRGWMAEERVWPERARRAKGMP